VDGRGANVPPILSNIHAFGAAKRFKCFLGPLAYKNKEIFINHQIILINFIALTILPVWFYSRRTVMTKMKL
jgi:hypothetical protein